MNSEKEAWVVGKVAAQSPTNRLRENARHQIVIYQRQLLKEKSDNQLFYRKVPRRPLRSLRSRIQAGPLPQYSIYEIVLKADTESYS